MIWPRFRQMVRLVRINFLIFAGLFLILELFVRFYGYFVNLPTGEFSLVNFAERTSLKNPYYPVNSHPLLGHVPLPGSHSMWGHKVVILPNSTRSNGEELDLVEPQILALGDSYTFGDEVANQETWPSQLQQQLNIGVINGGVFGYGLDQIILWGEQLDRFVTTQPSSYIISIIPDDIKRAELSVRAGVPKPYFVLSHAGLKLHPPPNNFLEHRTVLSKWYLNFRKIFGYSFLIHHVMKRVDSLDWQSARFTHKIHNDGAAVSCAILDKFSSKKKNVTLFVNYPKRSIELNERPKFLLQFFDCIKEKNVETLDFFDSLRSVYESDRQAFENFYGPSHMSGRGYKFVISILLKKSEVLKKTWKQTP